MALLMLTYDKECLIILLKVFNTYWIILLLSVVFCGVLEQKKIKHYKYIVLFKRPFLLCVLLLVNITISSTWGFIYHYVPANTLHFLGHQGILHCFKRTVFYLLLFFFLVKLLAFSWLFVGVACNILDISSLFFFHFIICQLTLFRVSFVEQ